MDNVAMGSCRYGEECALCDSWGNPEKGVSGDPRGGGNVLRGLSNKCLMRGTFPAIFFFPYKPCFLRFFLDGKFDLTLQANESQNARK